MGLPSAAFGWRYRIGRRPRPQGKARKLCAATAPINPENGPFSPAPATQTLARRSHREARTPATVEPNSLGLGATVSPQARMISAFSAALSPAAEMMAPAWPMRRPLGAVSPATKPITGFDMLSLILADASDS